MTAINPRLIYQDTFKQVMRDIDSMRWYNVAMSSRGPDDCISPAAFRGHGFVYTHNFCYVYKKSPDGTTNAWRSSRITPTQ